MAYDPEQRRAALQRFMRVNELRVFPWTTKAGLSESTIRGFLAGRTRTLGDETYVQLAIAATEMLGRSIHPGELRGELPRKIELPLQHYVGAGDEVYLISTDGAIDYVEGPPGYAEGSAVIVRGESMRPAFDPGDLLFFRKREPPPSFKDCPQRPVIVQITSDDDEPKLYVKRLLPGTRRGRYHLLSLNQLTPILQDQPVESIARIEWIKPAGS